MTRRPTIHQVVYALSMRIEELCHQFLPMGSRQGGLWVEASKARGGLGNSLKVQLEGQYQGTWRWYAADRGGDALELVTQFGFSGNKSDAWNWSVDYLGLSAGGDRPAPRLPSAEEIAERREKARLVEEERAAESQRKALGLWLHASPEVIDTPVDLYLESRGIRLSDMSVPPSVLRFHRELFHRETGRKHPAMVALITNLVTRKQVGVHRTYLEPAGIDGWQKLTGVTDGKLSWGRYKGGLIPLQRGVDARSWSDMPKGARVYVSEGLEDGLTIAQANPDLRVACGVSLGSMGAIAWPDEVTQIVLVGQHDRNPEPLAARERVIECWSGQGKEVRLILPPPGTGHDFNDALNHGGARG